MNISFAPLRGCPLIIGGGTQPKRKVGLEEPLLKKGYQKALVNS